MMINKEKTIKKAVSKYNIIYPVRGKHSLEECFFCLRGEYYFSFRTEDKKVHKMNADMVKQPLVSPEEKREAIDSLVKVLNKPIFFRSFLSKKPVNARLINLFPNPRVSWSSNSGTVPGNVRIEQTSKTVSGKVKNPETPSDVVPTMEEVARYTNQATDADVKEQIENSKMVADISKGATTYHYEILASGNLPVSPYGNLMPSLDEVARYSDNTPFIGKNNGENDVVDQGCPIIGDTTSYQYEVLATGYLPARDFDDELPSLDETLGYPGTMELPTLSDAAIEEYENIQTEEISEEAVQQAYSGSDDTGYDATRMAAREWHAHADEEYENVQTEEISDETVQRAYAASNETTNEVSHNKPAEEWQALANRDLTIYLHERPKPAPGHLPDQNLDKPFYSGLYNDNSPPQPQQGGLHRYPL